MPACFKLIDKTTNEPVEFVKIDEALCATFGVPVDPDKWYQDWYDGIGLCLASGATFDKIRDVYNEEPPIIEIVEIIDWLSARYRADSWHESR